MIDSFLYVQKKIVRRRKYMYAFKMEKMNAKSMTEDIEHMKSIIMMDLDAKVHLFGEI